MKRINSLFKTLLVVIIMMTPMVFQAKNHDVKNMAKHIDKVYFAASPEILENHGNMVTVTILPMFSNISGEAVMYTLSICFAMLFTSRFLA